jgi:hypothetical protein
MKCKYKCGSQTPGVLQPSPTVQRSSSRRQSESYTLLWENQIKFQDDRGKEVFKLLKDKEFTSTPLIGANLLQKIGTWRNSKWHPERTHVFLCMGLPRQLLWTIPFSRSSGPIPVAASASLSAVVVPSSSTTDRLWWARLLLGGGWPSHISWDGSAGDS